MRIKSAKIRAKRYDLNYFKRPTAFKRWRLGLSAGLAVLAVVVLGGFFWGNKRNIYSPGPVSPAHAYIDGKCDSCHQPKPSGGFSHSVTDDGCEKCHQVPDHHAGPAQKPVSLSSVSGDAAAKATPTPAKHTCGTCHVEHHGREQLVRLEDRQCVQCHSNLDSAFRAHNPKDNRSDTIPDASKPSPDIENSIEWFNKFNEGLPPSHPEFKAAMQPVEKHLNFSHKAHLGKAVLFPAPYPGEPPSPGATKVELACWDCHRPLDESASEQWKYAKKGARLTEPVPNSTRKLHPGSGQQFMLISNYEQQCAGCHDLKTDGRINDPDDQLIRHPGQLQEGLIGQLRQKFDEYLKAHPDEPLKPRCRPEKPCARPTREQWSAESAYRVLSLIKKKCLYCHESDPKAPSQAVLVVLESNLKPPEMQHAVFSHQSHRSLQCEECHTKVRTADKSSENLLPEIKTCRSCHQGNPGDAAQADNRCFLCHRYHDWPNGKSQPGEFTIEQLTGARIEGTPAAH